jgi:SAM-dependent methyltransferase
MLRLLIFFYSFASFFQRKIFIKNIKSEDLVLDVGSGDKPFWRADVIVDKFLDDNQQRASGEIIYDKRKIFVKADVENLPFKDKVFDFVFCSHLLEHVRNPDKAIEELMRVAKRGYIEIPSYVADFLNPFPSHLWFCDYENGFFIFTQKEKKKDFYLNGIERFGTKLLNVPLFVYLLAKHGDLVVIRHYWKDDIKYKIIKSRGHYDYMDRGHILHEKDFITKATFIFYKIFYTIISILFYRKKNIDIHSLLKKRQDF